MSEQLYLIFELLKFFGNWVFLTEGSDHCYLKVTYFVHIPLEVFGRYFVFQVKKKARMVDEDIASQSNIDVTSVLNLMIFISVEVFDLDKHVIDVSVTSPKQFEPITVIGQQIKTYAHPHRV